jgi:hypothetical protein
MTIIEELARTVCSVGMPADDVQRSSTIDVACSNQSGTSRVPPAIGFVVAAFQVTDGDRGTLQFTFPEDRTAWRI